MPDSTAMSARLAAAAQTVWDVIVVGAGPAGSLAARQLALRGKRVLLVDKATFPRDKVCGGCLNAAGADVLRRVGLNDLLPRIDAAPISTLRVACGRRQVALPLQNNLAISRARFDTALAAAAEQAGATLLNSVTAKPAKIDVAGAHGDRDSVQQRLVQLSHGSQTEVCAAKVVIVAAGLNGWHDQQQPAWQRQCASDSRVGVGAMLRSSANCLPAGVVQMVVGRGGYVGMVRLADGQIDVAAAFDRHTLAAAGSPARLAQQILISANCQVPGELLETTWHGTPAMTHQLPAVAGQRWFAIGDAAGYVEPFTGEGMAWALQTAAAVVPLATGAVDDDSAKAANQWQREYRRLLARRKWVCRSMARLLRHPWLAHSTVAALSVAPWLAAPLMRGVNRANLAAKSSY